MYIIVHPFIKGTKRTTPWFQRPVPRLITKWKSLTMIESIVPRARICFTHRAQGICPTFGTSLRALVWSSKWSSRSSSFARRPFFFFSSDRASVPEHSENPPFGRSGEQSQRSQSRQSVKRGSVLTLKKMKAARKPRLKRSQKKSEHATKLPRLYNCLLSIGWGQCWPWWIYNSWHGL